MPGDEELQEYSIKLLSDVILYTKRGIALVLKNLDYIYSSLTISLARTSQKQQGGNIAGWLWELSSTIVASYTMNSMLSGFYLKIDSRRLMLPSSIDLKSTASRLISLVVCSWNYLRR